MKGRALTALLALVLFVATSGWATAAEAAEPAKKGDPTATVGKEKRQKDPYRVIIGKLNAARRKAIMANPELKTLYDELRAKQRELAKQFQELYEKVEAASPEIAELAKKKKQMDEERRQKREEAMRKRREEREKKRRQRGKKGAERKEKKL